jgi:hypothetical protein
MKKHLEGIGIASAVIGSVFAFSASGWWLVLCFAMVAVPFVISQAKEQINNKNNKKEKENESI